MGRETAQSFPFLDAVVSGEGDAIFPTIVEHVQLGTEIPPIKGLYLRTGPGKATLRDPPSEIADPIRNLDDLPYPDYSDYFDQLGRSGIRFDGITPPHLVFETARGCWWGQRHHCTFCGLNGSTMAFRSKTPERALAELETLVKTYGDYPICVSDNILDQGYLRTFVPALKARTLGAKLFYEVKANLKKNDLRSLRDAGIDKIQPGIESFSTKVLKEMRKGISGIQNVQLLKWCCELGLMPVWGILWGFPQEQPSDYAEMADLIPSLTHLMPPIGITPIRLDRFSPNFVNAAAWGFRNVQPYPSNSYVYQLHGSAIANLSYFFTYDYEDGRDTSTYVKELVAEVRRWHEASGPSALFFADKGDRLVVFDQRPAASRSTHILAEPLRSIYLAADEITSFHALHKITQSMNSGWSEQDTRTQLQKLIHSRLMLKEAELHLSLAVKLGPFQPSPQVLAHLGRTHLTVEPETLRTTTSTSTAMKGEFQCPV